MVLTSCNNQWNEKTEVRCIIYHFHHLKLILWYDPSFSSHFSITLYYLIDPIAYLVPVMPKVIYYLCPDLWLVINIFHMKHWSCFSILTWPNLSCIQFQDMNNSISWNGAELSFKISSMVPFSKNIPLK